ncbi:hypothetical protein GCM10028805_22080 [Spirosoma harenae]
MTPASTSSASNQLEQLIDDLSLLTTHSIGRGVDNAIRISNDKISGSHARLIQCTPDSFVLEDLNSKNGTYVNGVRITRKVVGKQDTIRLADTDYSIDQLLDIQTSTSATSVLPKSPTYSQPIDPLSIEPSRSQTVALNFVPEFTALKEVYEQYPKLRRDCRNREKMVRTGSVLVSSLVGIGAVLSTAGGAIPLLHVLSGAGLSVLIPTLCSSLLSTEEKIEIIDKEYRERYRCPNPDCRDPFGVREWELLAQQKTCRRCQAIWVN